MITHYKYTKPYTFGDLLRKEIERQDPIERQRSAAIKLFNGPLPQPETVEL